MPACFDLLRRRLEADERHGTKAFIQVLRLLETHTLAQLSDAIEYALDHDVIDPDSIWSVLDHRAESPAALFRLDGRPHLAGVRVAVTDVAAYGAMLTAQATDRFETGVAS